jgi:hypothetical protein
VNRPSVRAAALAATGLLSERPVLGAPTWDHRLVRVHNPLASCFEVLDFEFQKGVRETYYGNFVSQEIVYRMFDAALGALTGEADPVTAMRRLVPYQTGERVFIKINTTSTGI